MMRTQHTAMFGVVEWLGFNGERFELGIPDPHVVVVWQRDREGRPIASAAKVRLQSRPPQVTENHRYVKFKSLGNDSFFHGGPFTFEDRVDGCDLVVINPVGDVSGLEMRPHQPRETEGETK